MDRLKRFMIGRYGMDQLSMALLILSLLFNSIGNLTRLPLLIVIGYILIGICISRVLSKDMSKRSMENYKFTTLIGPVCVRLKKIKMRLKESKIYKYFRCPNCKSKLRIPRGKGKVVITCPVCNTEFTNRT